jgi:large subunit ribosomal protein L22
MARAYGTSLPISTRNAVEVCNHLRGKNIETAKNILDLAIKEKKAIPFRRYDKDVGHKPGTGPGRYVVKTCFEIKKILESVQTNAQFKGLGTTNLKIIHLCANRAERNWHYGRHLRRKMKRTHIEVIVEEHDVKREHDNKKGKPAPESAHKETQTQKAESVSEIKAKKARPKKAESKKKQEENNNTKTQIPDNIKSETPEVK